MYSFTEATKECNFLEGILEVIVTLLRSNIAHPTSTGSWGAVHLQDPIIYYIRDLLQDTSLVNTTHIFQLCCRALASTLAGVYQLRLQISKVVILRLFATCQLPIEVILANKLLGIIEVTMCDLLSKTSPN